MPFLLTAISRLCFVTLEKFSPSRKLYSGFLRMLQSRDLMSKEGNAATAGLSMGSALAMILSFQLNHSILWAIIHGICSWFYVIYRAYKGDY
jgi:hypothetical protein